MWGQEKNKLEGTWALLGRSCPRRKESGPLSPVGQKLSWFSHFIQTTLNVGCNKLGSGSLKTTLVNAYGLVVIALGWETGDTS